MNLNELILDRVRNLCAYDLSTDELLMRLTSLEDPTLSCTAEGEEVTDAIGALITTLYRAKKATFSATNSLLSMDLAAAQYGAKKEVASEGKEIKASTYEILTVENGAIKLAHTPVADSIKYIYSYANNEISTKYAVGAEISETECVVAEDGTITVPTGLTGKVYVEYDFMSKQAVRVANKTSNFPEAVKLRIYCIFRDKCNENIVYSGVILCPKAKLNPEQVELALTATGKHAMEFQMFKDYCNEEDELFSIVVYAD